ncbi:uncharacterized protein XM38_034430 [Halomicronema hongdechloris C2206]|uniref:Uncharacterized protein n=1 Tax=Halomicronema hongdechloris C2206 TaxID=1641165 RepID=A0A1Z3HQG6_9CYAN|nr:hypothetical protein [Halomicronema hongdechloris]ASC72486.1 uncharacterized protein XM38_034430 [Halomicronema hongdechloris C2206]
MAIQIQSETQTNDGWAYEVTLTNGREHRYRVTLSQADYQAWSQERVPPAAVITAAFEFLLAREPASSILSSFDCSVIRRYFPAVDRELPKQLD